MYIDLDLEQDRPLSQEEIRKILNDDNDLQRNLQKQAGTTLLNKKLTEEIFDILTDIDFQYLNSNTEGDQYIDFENTRIPYTALRLAGRSEPARVIKNKRRLDLGKYGQIPLENDIKRGFKLVFVNPNYNPTKLEKAELEEWSVKIVNTFFYTAYSKYPNFSQFIGQAYEDWFDLDDITWEISRDGLYTPRCITIADPSIWSPVVKREQRDETKKFIRHNSEFFDEINNDESYLYFGSKADRRRKPDYLCIKNGLEIISQRATTDRIRKFHYFTPSDTRFAYRGYSVIEQGLKILTYILNAINMNASNFTNTKMPDGVLAFNKSNIGRPQLEALKQILYGQMSGASNQKRLPMIASKDGTIDWVSFRSNMRDMEYHKFMALSLSIFAMLSGTDPREVNWGSYTDATSTGAMFDKNTDGMIKESKDSGAWAFLTHLEGGLNAPNDKGRNMFQELTGMDVKGQFFGLSIEDRELKEKITALKLSNTMTLNEALAEQDKEKFEIMIGDKNLYDIPGFSNDKVFQAVMASAQDQKMQSAAENQPPAEPAPKTPETKETTEKPGKEELTAADRALIEKYGEPEDYKISEDAA
jgi:hypothetical protein